MMVAVRPSVLLQMCYMSYLVMGAEREIMLWLFASRSLSCDDYYINQLVC